MKKSQEINIYVDGSCSGNPGPAGVGVLLEWNGIERKISRSIGTATNNIAELMAIKIALQELKAHTYPVRIYTDSQYVYGLLKLDWKAKVNSNLVNSIKKLLQRFDDVKFFKITGHSGVAGNEVADKLAKEASGAK